MLEKVEMHVLATVTELCPAKLQGEVLDDKPCYHSTLRQVHTHMQAHTQMHSTHTNTLR